MDKNFIFGDAVKATPDGKVSGWLVRFSNGEQIDLQGEYFTKDTNFGDAVKSDIHYHHGFDKGMGDKFKAKGSIEIFDEGVWIESQLDISNKYQRAVLGLAQRGVLGWSAGSMGSRIRTKKSVNGATEILSFPLGLDASLTPKPVEPLTIPGMLDYATMKGLTPADMEGLLEGSNTESSIAVDNLTITTKGITIMQTDENGTPPEETKETLPVDTNADALKAVQAEMLVQSAQMKSMLDTIAQSGKLKDLGYLAPDSEGNDNHNETKSLGDFLVAVSNKNEGRLAKVYDLKAQVEASGKLGGYLVPEQFLPKIFEVMGQASQIIPRVTNQPVSSPTGQYPSLDQSVAPTAGTGEDALNAGLDTNARAESGAYTEETMNFRMIEWKVNDSLSGYVKVSRELSQDAPFIETLLRNRIALTQQTKTEFFILRGNGVNQPTGILNAACAIGIQPATSNVFAVADAAEMESRFESVGGEPVWIMHKSLISDLVAMESSSGGAVWQANYTSGIGTSLLGHPIIFSRHMPQANSSGSVILADLSVFALFNLGGIYVDFSEHADFLNGNGVWRFGGRIDGKAQLNAAIPDASPEGSYTQSPIVYDTTTAA